MRTRVPGEDQRRNGGPAAVIIPAVDCPSRDTTDFLIIARDLQKASEAQLWDPSR